MQASNLHTKRSILLPGHEQRVVIRKFMTMHMPANDASSGDPCPSRVFMLTVDDVVALKRSMESVLHKSSSTSAIAGA